MLKVSSSRCEGLGNKDRYKADYWAQAAHHFQVQHTIAGLMCMNRDVICTAGGSAAGGRATQALSLGQHIPGSYWGTGLDAMYLTLSRLCNTRELRSATMDHVRGPATIAKTICRRVKCERRLDAFPALQGCITAR